MFNKIAQNQIKETQYSSLHESYELNNSTIKEKSEGTKSVQSLFKYS